MKNTVIFISSIIPDELKSYLEQIFDVVFFKEINLHNHLDIIKALEKAVGIIAAPTPQLNSLLKHAPNLKTISTISVGYDHLDLDYLKANKITLMHTPTVLTEATADTIFTLILATAKRTTELNHLVKHGKWIKTIQPTHYGTDVFGKTLGILGMGRIGKAVAKRGHMGFDMNILYYSNNTQPDAEGKYKAIRCNLDELLAKSDFVCITLPLTNQTKHLINKEKLALMKPSAILINGGRGPIVDEKALIEALENKVIKAAGLDVFEIEPLNPSSPLIKMDNTVLLPHVGSATHETRHAMVKCAIDNLIAALNNNAIENVVII